MFVFGGGFILSVVYFCFDVFAVVDCDTIFRVKVSEVLLSLLSCFISLIRHSCSILSINYIKYVIKYSFLN